jgi:hypothetical protein
VKAIEVLPAGSALTINSGGGSFTTTTGKVFSSDVYYADGSVSSITSGEVANTTEDALYLNGRFGPSFSYGIPSGNGTFDVVLHFNETFYGYRVVGGAGSRKFNVYLEGVKRLSEYDIFAKAGGAMKAVRETLRVTVSDGILNLYFAKGSADNPIIAAIEVIPASTARLASAEGVEKGRPSVYPNPVRDILMVRLPFAAEQVKATAVHDAKGVVHLVNAHKPVGENQLEIRVESLPKGFFLLKVATQEESLLLKFVKQ